jgi:lysozyme family protein
MGPTTVTPDEQVLELLAAGPLSPVAEERAVPQLDHALTREYATLFASCKVRPERAQSIDRVLDQIVESRARYGGVESVLGTPWYVIAAIHSLEAGLRFDRHLHNGDPLSGRTTHVPAGRPPGGSPPFTWEASAQDALVMRALDRWEDWSVAGTLFKLEQYNGWGYRQFHPEVRSPYLWSFCQHYTKGKYVADGRFDANAVSQQCGAAVLLRRMADRGLIPGWSAPATGPLLRYSGGTVAPHGAELQTFLNTLPGIELEVDGKLGPNTSKAVQLAFGQLLAGDPRAPHASQPAPAEPAVA